MLKKWYLTFLTGDLYNPAFTITIIMGHNQESVPGVGRTQALLSTGARAA